MSSSSSGIPKGTQLQKTVKTIKKIKISAADANRAGELVK